MNDQSSNHDDETTPMAGDNLARAEIAAGIAGRKAIAAYDRLHDRIAKMVPAIHEAILTYGRALREGRDLHASPKEFGWWVERRHLNTGRLGSQPVERSNALKLADLVDVGVEGMRLDLTLCKLTTPSNIMKWARSTHRHLFLHLRPAHAVSNKSTTKVTRAGAASEASSPLANVCCFCGKSATQVKELLLAPVVVAAICDGCVEIAVKLVAERKQPQGKARTFAQAFDNPSLDDI